MPRAVSCWQPLAMTQHIFSTLHAVWLSPHCPCTTKQPFEYWWASAGCCFPKYSGRPQAGVAHVALASARSCRAFPAGGRCCVKSQQRRDSSWWSHPHPAPRTQCAGINSWRHFFLFFLLCKPLHSSHLLVYRLLVYVTLAGMWLFWALDLFLHAEHACL